MTTQVTSRPLADFTGARFAPEIGAVKRMFFPSDTRRIAYQTSMPSASSALSMMKRKRAEASRPIKSLITLSVSS